MKNKTASTYILVLLLYGLYVLPVSADHGAELLLTPSAGSFVVGSTFDISLMVSTNGEEVNAIAGQLSFPPDKLQVISSSAGKSVIDLWSVPPRFNNSAGTIELQGVITNGLNASRALITTVAFRVKSTGSAAIRIVDGSRVLKHDGKGTDFLQHQVDGIYTLLLPPPAGPLVASETHPDQELWYRDPNISLAWALQGGGVADGYSYVLNSTPVEIPDNTSEGTDPWVVYQQVSEGLKYFHIKALRNGIWGGTTHFAIQIDASAPADFPIEVSPKARTSEKQPVVRFVSTDALSGIDHYELKIVSLSASKEFQFPDQPLFIEVQSPFVLPELGRGRYDVLVRAYDKAGNFRESVLRLTIRDVFFGIASQEGFEVDGWFVIPWSWLIIILLCIIAFLVYEALHLHHTNHALSSGHQRGLSSSMRNQLEELKRYRDKYGKMGIFLLFVSLGMFMGGTILHARELKTEPPLITSLSRNISNQDIFYVGGKTSIPKSTVVFYVQNLTTGESSSFETPSDEYGDWFYTHDTFLSTGEYVLWAQTKIGDIESAPGPQEKLTVRPTAIQFGSSRLSYDIIYQIALVFLLLLSGFLGNVVIQMRRRLRRRSERLMKEVREAEEAVRKGFAVLKRDIQAELDVMRKAKMERSLRQEEQEREAQLLGDLASIQRRIGKEIEDIEALE
ncbi:MAG: Uncharacterized protein G01um101470_581 [Parcubacteria group bacterium Gr01-1014_70]|nr:MAG: Uncharacterized protein G01um101470_581 [Parcubacteria group bacterium Gr01-1014_70]